jgi:hypothetical protein
LVKPDYRLGVPGAPGEKVIPLAAFAHEPADVRSACVAVLGRDGDPATAVLSCRGLGAPVVFVCHADRLQWWNQGTDRPRQQEEIPASLLNTFFHAHRTEFSPDAIYRAKTRGRLGEGQLRFVDIGLMPLVEREIGERLTSLVERVFGRLKHDLGFEEPTAAEGHWLLRAAFWLLAAKVLRDKEVPGFKTLSLSDPRDAWARLQKHYCSADASVPSFTRSELAALGSAAAIVDQFDSLAHVTVESLAAVYETAFITKEQRKAWGIHSTPAFLVDYMLWRLAPWITEIPAGERRIFEPACGHGAFLVGAMRLLRDLLPATTPEKRHDYLRTRLCGLDQDAFAIEVARLSLTLADVPNPNGWRLERGDMFQGQALARRAADAMILLANPPFEKFARTDQAKYGRPGATLLNTKAAEVFGRTLRHLRPGAVFGLVAPQGFLHSENGRELRAWMLDNLELLEVSLFADKLFAHADVESSILLGRRPPIAVRTNVTVRYRRVREADIALFRSSYQATTERAVPQARFRTDELRDIRLPELEEVWACLGGVLHLEDLALSGKGFDFVGRRSLRQSEVTWSRRPFPGSVRGFVRLAESVQIHELPPLFYVNLAPSVIATARTGLAVGIPQVLLNYARVSRGPWRLKGLLDRKGHPVTSNFLTVRPRSEDTCLEYLWALVNSPLSNAFAFTHSEKRHVLAGTMRQLPVPRASNTDMQRVTDAVRAYFAEVSPAEEGLKAQTSPDRARDLLLAVEAEVLRLYGLPPRLERQVLDLFAGHLRPGVPFAFDRYYPDGFVPFVPLHVYLSENYRRSTAGELQRRATDVRPSDELLAALDAAVEAFSVDD